MDSEGQPVTIRDIARHAGVSSSTVSRVLNGTTPVHAAKRRAVLEAIEALGYRPNIVAQGLARAHSRAVGVLTEEIASSFYGQIAGAIEDGLRGTGYYPVFASGRAELQATQALQLLSDSRIGALIVVGGRMLDNHLLRMHTQHRVPVIVIGRSIMGMEEHCVHVENLEGAASATRHLIELGHRRIAHVAGVAGHRHTLDRVEGYRKALAQAGIEYDPALVVSGDFDEDSGYRAVRGLLDRGVAFTAVFAASDQMAYGAALTLYEHDLCVPKDVSLVGFDDQLHAMYCVPPLTTVRQPSVEMGQAAVAALLDLLLGRPFELPTFRTELIVRRSTAPPKATAD
jgi:LacI family transcriptional regulator